jgi:hypothetical protein
MPKPTAPDATNDSMSVLSRLLLPRRTNDSAEQHAQIAGISRDRFDHLVALANLNHVIVRGLTVFLHIVRDAGDGMRAEWASVALAAERERIKNSILVLRAVCSAFESAGSGVTVIKSLDHWPDLGSDLDLYSSADPDEISQLMKERFNAQLAPRSWGDRLAGKWNFLIPGLPEPIEIHVGRLGQTGEQASIAAALPARSRLLSIGEHTFRVTSPSDRLMISTLQRMYRHFFFRLCDIIDTVELAESGAIDYEDLRQVATAAGIWQGVATYLAIVSDYAEKYRGMGLNLPYYVRASARFGGNQLYFRQDFLRVPIMPQSASLYGLQLSGLLRKWQLQSSARLSLLPWLATAAVVGQKLTGSDKGIW